MSKRDLKEEMWDQSKEWIDAIGDVITAMAGKLGIAGEHVYEVYTRQMFVEGLVWSIFLLFVYIALITATILIHNYCVRNFHTEEHKQERGYDPTTRLIPIVVGGVLTLLTFAFTADVLIENVMKVFNPEYYTLKYLLDTAKDMMGK